MRTKFPGTRMPGTRMLVLSCGLALVAGASLVACSGDGDGGSRTVDEEPGEEVAGFVAADHFRARQDDYLAFATAERDEGSILNLLNHLERAERDPGFTPVATDVGPEAFSSAWERIDGYLDTADFDLLYLVNLWLAHGDALDPELRERIESELVDFKYWYDDPTPEGVFDQRWYWSENHRIIFHTLEYLAGQELADETFTVTGMTGTEHRDRAAAWIEQWLEEKAAFGFSEWHSDVYYQKDITPLLALVEFADDRELAERAAMVLDLVFYDLALHTLDANNGVTHGRSYMKDKSIAADQDVFGLVKLAFDQTDEPYTSVGDAGASLLARAERYRLPEAVLAVATSEEVMVDRERMGVPIGVEGELVTVPDRPEGPLGPDGTEIAFDDPDALAFWWERGALTAWPVVPLTLETIEAQSLWDTPAFGQFRAVRDIVYDAEAGEYDMVGAQELAYSLRDMINIGLLDEVNTYTYRTADVMLSSAQDYRPGAHGNQYHAWQATLGPRAVVFTTHPGNEPRTGDRYVDGDLYWNGTGSMPRSAQHGSAAIHLYAPAFDNPGEGLLESFGFLDETHAWFPTEEFDEVVQADGWTFGRHDGGYVALWSWRPTQWRTHGPEVVNQNGLTEPYDLVAAGGPDNVWVVEVADEAEWDGDFAAFMEAMVAAPPRVVELTPDAGNGPYGGFDVTWTSPSQGELAFGTTAAFTVDGEEVALDGYPRFDNPFSEVPFGDPVVEVDAGGHTLRLDFETWTRAVR